MNFAVCWIEHGRSLLFPVSWASDEPFKRWAEMQIIDIKYDNKTCFDYDAAIGMI